MVIVFEVLGVLLVCTSAALFDWRLVPATVGLFLIYVARGG